MKSNKIIVLIITLMVSLTFSFYYSVNVKADSGFDSSWDSGGSDFDSGSSWDSGSSYDSGSSWSSGSSGGNYSSSPSSLFNFIMAMFGTFIPFIIFFIVITTILSATKKNTNNISYYNRRLTKEEIDAKLGETFNIDNFYNETFKIYKDIQIAWMDLDIERVRNILSDEMLNSYKMQLETLKVKNQKNMMEDINLVDVYITNIYQKNNQDVIDVIMKVTCKDYLIDINSNKVLRGEKNKVWNYEYKLSYMRTNISNELNYCPNCGSKLSEGSSVKCTYCNAIINKETDKFILIDKKMISQR